MNEKIEITKDNIDFYVTVLRSYLNRFRRCRNRERTLRERKDMIISYIKNGQLLGPQLSGMPTASGKKSDPTVKLTMELDDVECQIGTQIERSVDVMLEISEMIEYLPQDSDERNVLEAKYIDCQNQYRIMRDLSISKSTLYRYARSGLEQLLEYEKILLIIDAYADEIERGDEQLDREAAEEE